MPNQLSSSKTDLRCFLKWASSCRSLRPYCASSRIVSTDIMHYAFSLLAFSIIFLSENKIKKQSSPRNGSSGTHLIPSAPKQAMHSILFHTHARTLCTPFIVCPGGLRIFPFRKGIFSSGVLLSFLEHFSVSGKIFSFGKNKRTG